MNAETPANLNSCGCDTSCCTGGEWDLGRSDDAVGVDDVAGEASASACC